MDKRNVPKKIQDEIMHWADFNDRESKKRFYEQQIGTVIVSTMPKAFVLKMGYFHFWFCGNDDGKGVSAKFYGVHKEEMDKIKEHMIKNAHGFMPLIQNLLDAQKEKYTLERIQDIDFNGRFML